MGGRTIVHMMMRTLVAGAVTGLLGFGGAVAGYQQFVAPTADPTVPVASSDPTAAAASPSRERSRVKFEKCPRGFKLERRVCVQRIERTVVVDGAAPAPAAAPRQITPVRALPAAPAAPAAGGGHDGSGDESDGYRDDEYDHEDDDAYGDHRGDEDHEDEDHEDEDHEDEDHEDEDHEDEDHEDDD